MQRQLQCPSAKYRLIHSQSWKFALNTDSSSAAAAVSQCLCACESAELAATCFPKLERRDGHTLGVSNSVRLKRRCGAIKRGLKSWFLRFTLALVSACHKHLSHHPRSATAYCNGFHWLRMPGHNLHPVCVPRVRRIHKLTARMRWLPELHLSLAVWAARDRDLRSYASVWKVSEESCVLTCSWY